MVLLDTNVLYLVLELEKNEKVDLYRLKSYISDNKCTISIYSFFEMLNSKLLFKQKLKVIEYLAKNKIQIESNPKINAKVQNELFGKIKNEQYYNYLKKIYGEHIINEISSNIQFFIVSYAYVSATIYLDNYERGVSNAKKYYRKHFVLIQKEIDKHIGKIVLNNLRKLLETDNFNAENVQKMLLLLVANLMTYYYELLKYAKNIFENKYNSAYYKLIKKFKKLKNLILKDKMQDIIDFDFKYLSVCRIIIEQFNT